MTGARALVAARMSGVIVAQLACAGPPSRSPSAAAAPRPRPFAVQAASIAVLLIGPVVARDHGIHVRLRLQQCAPPSRRRLSSRHELLRVAQHCAEARARRAPRRRRGGGVAAAPRKITPHSAVQIWRAVLALRRAASYAGASNGVTATNYDTFVPQKASDQSKREADLKAWPQELCPGRSRPPCICCRRSRSARRPRRGARRASRRPPRRRRRRAPTRPAGCAAQDLRDVGIAL